MTDAAGRLGRLTTTAAALLLPLVYAPALEAPFLVPKLAVLEITGALGFVALAVSVVSGRFAPWSRAVVVGLVLVAATTGLAWWSAVARGSPVPYALDACGRGMAIVGLACGVVAMGDAVDARRRLLEAVTVACGTVAVLGLLQHVDALPLALPVISLPGSTFGNRNLAAEVVAMAIPLGLAASFAAPTRDGRAALATGTALEVVYLAVTRARGGWLGAACGVVAFAVLARPSELLAALRDARRFGLAAFAVLALAVVAASLPGRMNPRDAGDSKRYAGLVSVLEDGVDARAPALRTRLGLWRRTVRMAADQPFAGVGPGNWPVVFPRYAGPSAADEGVLTATLAPRQAHDDLLERLAETGVAGALALFVLCGATFVHASRRAASSRGEGRLVVAGASGALFALAGVSVAGFPLDMPATAGLSGLALGLVAVRGPSRAVGRAGRRAAVLGVVVAVALTVGAGLRGARHVRASYWLAVAEAALRHDTGPAGADAALGPLERSLAAEPRSYLAALRTSQMWLRKGEVERATDAARRALDIEPDAPNAWAALASARLRAGDAPGAEGAATRALEALYDYPVALDVRARAATSRGAITAAEADRDHLARLASSASDPATRNAAARLRGARD